jgi:hypothetical protein
MILKASNEAPNIEAAFCTADDFEREGEAQK